MDLFRPTYLHIHLDRLMNNYSRLQALSGQESFLCPMIKANAYGHGDIGVAKALVQKNCQFLGVACVEEGVRLRESHIATSILVFGFHGREALKELLAKQLTPVVSNFEQLHGLVQEVRRSTSIHIKLNTGMNRLGFKKEELEQLNEQLLKNPFLVVDGLCTHLFTGQNVDTEGESSTQQLNIYRSMVTQLGRTVRYKHVYNSSAMASIYKKKGEFRYGCRPGLLVYGIDPSPNQSLKPLISPVMEFKSKIVTTQAVKSGEVVSYGGTWTAQKDSLIGIIPAGYADGVSRGLSSCGEVLVSGKRVPIRGRVCMDYTMVDLTELKMTSDSLVSQEVVFIGRQGDEEISVEDVARVSGRINYEIMTGISERVPRLYGAI